MSAGFEVGESTTATMEAWVVQSYVSVGRWLDLSPSHRTFREAMDHKNWASTPRSQTSGLRPTLRIVHRRTTVQEEVVA
jgi:hypothetical protein